jgi:DNA (cytosine-5)-methyltransferase 1
MEKTVCELFAGVGGFRCGLNHIKNKDDIAHEEWKTVWYSQWEPAESKTQYAHDCYNYNFGTCLDLDGNDTTNFNIEDVDKRKIPNHSLLVGGFPCQDYSVASSLKTSKGLEGKKGILWWSIRDVLEAKRPPFVLLENVDRLIKSPAKQRGRDFSIILACFRDEGYTVEWRVINASDYGFQQRRRRTFIFAYRNDTQYSKSINNAIRYSREHNEVAHKKSIRELVFEEGFFARSFKIKADDSIIRVACLPDELGEISEKFHFVFENSGVMKDGIIYTLKTTADYHGKQITLGDILEDGEVAEEYFIPENRLYYTNPAITHSDETKEILPKEKRQTWQYLKGAKKLPRKSDNGHEYIFSEGAIPMLDDYDKPARTMLTSEGNFSRTTHIVRDKLTGRIRLLTPIETERIQGFPDNHTKYCKVGDSIVEMPTNKRRFMMGNALVVNVIEAMEPQLRQIIEEEG